MNPKRRALPALLAALLLLTLSACAAQQGRTDQYDGYTVRTEKTAPPPAAVRETELPATRALDDGGAEDYVLNLSSMRFHNPSCPSVPGIKEKNRWDYHGTRESVVDMGYEPCRICNP